MSDDHSDDHHRRDGEGQRPGPLIAANAARSDDHHRDGGGQPPGSLIAANAARSELGTYTITEAIDSFGFGPFQWKLLLLTGGVFAADAMEMMLLTLIIPLVQDDWNLADGVDGLLGAVVFFGMFLGAHFWGVWSDKKGRRLGILAVLSFTFVCGLSSAFSPSISVLIVLRFLVGFGIGGAPVAFSLFAEYLPTHARGRMLILFELFWTAGVCIEAGLGWLVLDAQGWRWLLVWSSVPLLVLLLLFRSFPESARYYEVSGQHGQAKRMVMAVAKANHCEVPAGELVTHTTYDRKLGGVRALLQPEVRHTTLLLWCIWATSTMTYYGVAFMLPRLFDKDESTYKLVFLASLAEIPANVIPALWLVDRIGRKQTLIWSFVLCAGACVCVIATMGSQQWIRLAFVMVARAAATAAFSTVYVYTPEVYPTVYRTTGVGAASSVARLAGIVSSFIAEDMDESLGLAVYAVTSLIAAFCTWCLRRETSGVGLGDTGQTPMASADSDAQASVSSKYRSVVVANQ